MSRVVSEITADTPPPAYRYLARCQECEWTDDWPQQRGAEMAARRHIELTKHAKVQIEDREAAA